MDESDTPPEAKRGAPPRPLPTLTSLQASVDAAVREIRGARLDVDQLKTSLRAVRATLDAPTPPPISIIPKPTPVPEARPSMAAKAAHGTRVFGKYTAYVVAVAAVLGQVIAAALPHQQGPLVELLRVLLAFVQQQGAQ